MEMMLNSIKPAIRHSVSFKDNNKNQAKPAVNLPAQPLPAVMIEGNQKQDNSFGIKNIIVSVKKAFINVKEYISGAAEGIAFGAVAAGVTYGLIAVKNTVKAGLNLFNKDVKKHILPQKWGKVASVAVGLAVLGYSLFKSKLNVNEKTADVDHRWNAGHREV